MKHDYYIISFSGGKDSTALTIEWLKRNQNDPITYPLNEVIYCDVGMEFPEMVKHINLIEKLVVSYGIKFNRLKSDQSFDFLMFHYKPIRRNQLLKDKSGWSWPTPTSRWCTRHLKINVINEYLDSLQDQYSIISLIGIAADEQSRLTRKHNQNPNHHHPLIDWGWTEKDCLNYCYDHGYDWGGLYELFSRTSCWCCPLQNLDDLRKLRKHFPELWKKLLNMEHKTWKTFRYDYSVDDLEIRFSFEEERLSKGLPINRTREFMREFRERIKMNKS